jgi:hypothetical protein
MADFGFVGASYTTPSIYQDDQECINFFAELDPTKQPGDRGIVALYPTPGLTKQIQLPQTEVRGIRALSGGKYLIVVCSEKVYKVDTSYVYTEIGTLVTNSGYVSISDNVTQDDGLTAYIVDGPCRYTWVASTNKFLQLPLGDGAWSGATVVAVVDNYNIYNQPGTQNWGCTDLGSSLSTEGLYGVKDAYPDNLVTLIVDRRQVYLLGETTTEVWTDVGNVIAGILTFPFQRVPGTSVQCGIAAPASVARLADSFAFVAQDTRGTATIRAMSGYQVKRISTHAVEQSLLGETVSNAVAYTYQLEGHEMYVVTFPSIGNGLTWVYDASTQVWHKWLSWSNGQYYRHRSNCGAFFNGKYLVGDYANGKIYSIENAVYTEDGSTIRRLRRAVHLVNDFQRTYFDEMQVQFQPGVGVYTALYDNYISVVDPFVLTSAQTYTIAANDIVYIGPAPPIPTTADPQAMLRWSNDGGSTWSSEHWVSVGQQGKYKNRAIWRRLGMARDRIFEVAVSDAVKFVVVSANLKASVGEN